MAYLAGAHSSENPADPGSSVQPGKPVELQPAVLGAVLVTGASTGIGRACAEMLAARGYLAFAGVRRESDAEALRALSPRIAPVMLDVTRADSIRQALDFITARLNSPASGEDHSESTGRGLAGLVNNAGTVFAAPLELLPVEDFRMQLEINVTGQLAVTQAFLPLLRAGRGRVVNMGSVSGLVAFPCSGAYAASKFALEAVTDALRQELKPFGLHVSIVEPGAIATPIWDKGVQGAERRALAAEPRLFQLYEPLLKAARAGSRRAVSRAAPPEAVARLVIHALTAKTPKTRYRVGVNANLVAFLRLLPDIWRDRIVAAKFRSLN